MPRLVGISERLDALDDAVIVRVGALVTLTLALTLTLTLALAVALALTLALTLTVALALALTGTLTLTLALAHATAIALAAFALALARALAGADTAGCGLALVVGDQRVGVGRVQREVVAIRVGVQGVGTLQELAIVRPAVIVGVEQIISDIRGV